MPPSPCAICATNRAMILRPKNHQKLCRDCFITVFEEEIHRTIVSTNLFQRGERIAIGASGGKDSTVLASVLKTLNQRYDYGLDLVLLSIDEGIKGYRDDSLETVKRNAQQYDLPLTIIGYDELYGWTMDQVVEQIGKKGNCTYCGVFRRQALDRGAARLGVEHVVTGHNADDVAETVLMNLLRGDLPRLSRTTSIVTSTPSGRASSSANQDLANIKRSKPLKYAYEKEIVLYAHHKKLDYFSTECIYSPEAFRGSARTLVKNLERVRPSAILDIVRSGEDMAPLVPGSVSRRECRGACQNKKDVPREIPADEEEIGGCGIARDNGSGGEMARMERKLQDDESVQSRGLEVDITTYKTNGAPVSNGMQNGRPKDNRQPTKRIEPRKGRHDLPRKAVKQTMGQCSRCGYISSQAVCKACMLLEGLNKNRPKKTIGITTDETQDPQNATNGLKKLDLAGD